MMRSTILLEIRFIQLRAITYHLIFHFLIKKLLFNKLLNEKITLRVLMAGFYISSTRNLSGNEKENIFFYHHGLKFFIKATII